MKYKMMVTCAIIAGSMHHAWGMETETARLKMRVYELEKEVANLRKEVQTIKQNKDLEKELNELRRTVNIVKTALEGQGIAKKQCVRQNDDME